ncbi:MAG: hypothetical protein K0Q79_48 [Flavipsychrobacter sp.]|nr:hypothetical protein [Flavipsychrobacter sp.]
MPPAGRNSFFMIPEKTMKEKHNEATFNRPMGDRPIDARFVKIDVPFYMQTIKHEEAWQKNDRNAITVFKSDAMCIVLVAMHKQAELTYHVAESIASIQVLEGAMSFRTDGALFDIKQGEIVALHDGLNYSLQANEEAVFLLTISYLKEKLL